MVFTAAPLLLTGAAAHAIIASTISKTLNRTSSRRRKFRESRKNDASAILAASVNGPGSRGVKGTRRVSFAGIAPVIEAEGIRVPCDDLRAKVLSMTNGQLFVPAKE